MATNSRATESVEEKLWTVLANDHLDPEITERAARFLQSFLTPGGPTVWSKEHFHWKLGNSNPAGPGFMTVALHRGEVIGVTTITRKRFWDGHQEVPAAEIGDTFSHPSFRREGRAAQPYRRSGKEDEYLSKSVFGRLVTETMERALGPVGPLIYGTPNPNSMPGYVNRLGFFDYQSHYNRYFVRPGAAALTKRLRSLSPLACLIYPLDKGYGRVISRIWSQLGGFRVEELSDPGEEADRLWQRLRHKMPMGPVRDGDYFRHRFLANPLSKYRFWSVHLAGEIIALFVTRTITHDDHLNSCHLADWLLDPSIKGIFKFIAAHMVAVLGDPTTKSYGFWAERGWAGHQGLTPVGFLARGRVPIIFHGDQRCRDLELSGTRFHFTLATSDNI